MKANFKMDPFPHVLLEDFYTKGEHEACLRELRKLDPHLLPPEFSGTARDKATGRPLKYNAGLFLTDAFPNSEIVKFARGHMFQELVDQVECPWWESQWIVNVAPVSPCPCLWSSGVVSSRPFVC